MRRLLKWIGHAAGVLGLLGGLLLAGLWWDTATHSHWVTLRVFGVGGNLVAYERQVMVVAKAESSLEPGASHAAWSRWAQQGGDELMWRIREDVHTRELWGGLGLGAGRSGQPDDLGPIRVAVRGPAWVLAFAFAAVVAGWGVVVVRRLRRPRPRHCPACGYDLRGTPDAAACPECGHGLFPGD